MTQTELNDYQYKLYNLLVLYMKDLELYKELYENDYNVRVGIQILPIKFSIGKSKLKQEDK